MFSNICHIVGPSKDFHTKISLPSKTDVRVNIQASLSHRSKEVEDISPKKAKRIRSLSLSRINKSALSADEEIKKRDGHLWECYGRKPNKELGYIYQFKLRVAYDDLTPSDAMLQHAEAATKKNKEIDPAREIRSESIFFKSNFVEQKFEIEVAKTLKFLGYAFRSCKDGVFLDLPDRDTLIHQWELLQEQDPTLPVLDIVSSEGIAGDLSFVQSIFTHDVLLSEGREFVHDHSSHILATIILILRLKHEDKKFHLERLKVIKVIMKIYRDIIHFDEFAKQGKINLTDEQKRKLPSIIKVMIATLGAYVDLFTNRKSFLELQHFEHKYLTIQNFSEKIWTTDSAFYDSFKKRFPETTFEEIKTFWHRIRHSMRPVQISGIFLKNIPIKSLKSYQ